jgi:hypothetical protein
VNFPADYLKDRIIYWSTAPDSQAPPPVVTPPPVVVPDPPASPYAELTDRTLLERIAAKLEV